MGSGTDPLGSLFSKRAIFEAGASVGAESGVDNDEFKVEEGDERGTLLLLTVGEVEFERLEVLEGAVTVCGTKGNPCGSW